MKIAISTREPEFHVIDVKLLLEKHAKEAYIDRDRLIIVDPDEFLLEELENRGIKYEVLSNLGDPDPPRGRKKKRTKVEEEKEEVEELERKIEEVIRKKKELEAKLAKFGEVKSKLKVVFESYLMGRGLPSDKIQALLKEAEYDIDTLAREVVEGKKSQESAVNWVRRLADELAEKIEVPPAAIPLPPKIVELLNVATELLRYPRKNVREVAKLMVEEIVEEAIRMTPGVYVIKDETGKVWFETNDKVQAGYMASKLSLEYPDKIFTIYKRLDDVEQKLEIWKEGAVEQIVPFWEW